MAAKRLLTYASDGRWRKQIDGKMHYFGKGRSKQDTRSYREAERRYLEFMKSKERHLPIEIDVRVALVEDVAERFMQQQGARYAADQISPSYLEKTRSELQHFVNWAGKDTPIAEINEIDLEDYKTHVLNLAGKEKMHGGISLYTAKGRLDSVRRIIEQAHETRIIEHLPRNLRRFSRLELPRPEPKIFNQKELEQLWSNADERMRAWICCAINAGMGQKDISDLRVGEINFDGGYIERDRSKTGISGRWKMFMITSFLLRTHLPIDAKAGDRVFLTSNGCELVRERHVDGKLKKSDAVRSAFVRLVHRSEIERGRGFYCLRKTAATMIEQINPSATSLFLGHSERGMKKHYAARNWNSLDNSLDELRARLDFMAHAAKEPNADESSV